MAIVGKVETITPPEAARYREKMVKNRPLSERTAKGYADAMARGEWKVNGEAAIFDEAGVLLDGQHRMRAIELYGKSVEIMVVRGVKASTFSTIDCGLKRSTGNVLAIQGYPDSNLLAASLQWAHKWERGVFTNAGGGSPRVTSPEILRLAARWPDMGEHVRAVYVGTGLFARAHWVFMRWATTNAKPTEAKKFWDPLLDGAGLVSGSAAHRLHQRVTTDGSLRAKIPAHIWLAMGIHAWNAHVEGRSIKIVRQRDNEPMPNIKGFTPPGVEIK